ncbi:adaptor protein MecA [Bacillus lacus]|uniref:Adapter protein MecA n=1 Tax=Metabacillus lacus TaxID=1983721 RepID=A0A7X2J2Y7_9BACI|nr:adaptor protein MecA [Metabacillus lacus]MRX73618.1 adaptor protein MecA [Metabacillus lacus]
MEIERINDYTVKFYISYLDIEERGFDRDEIWYNRERSEELFWEMMDEVHDEEDFMVEGPLWIQVQALDKGLEVIVTRAQVSKDGHKIELPVSEDNMKDLASGDGVDSLIDQHYSNSDSEDEQAPQEEQELKFILKFNDFENLISLSKLPIDMVDNQLFSYENMYYLFVQFDEQSDKEIEDMLSIMLEYGVESRMTIHRLEEYGNSIIRENALHTIRQHFQ